MVYLQTKSKQITMAYIENATTIEPKVGNYSYLCGMKDQKEIELDAMIDELMKEQLPPYTMEEINAMIDEGERQFADGRWQDSEDMFRELEEEFEKSESQSV